MLTGNSGSIVLRGQLPPGQMAESLRVVVHSIDPQLPLTQVESMDRVVGEGQASRRFNATLISAFAGAAVLLAGLGIYSVIAFSAALRTQEMAIRLALGSQRSSVMRLILVSGAKLGAGRLRDRRRYCSALRHPSSAVVAVPGRSAGSGHPGAGGCLHPPARARGVGHSCPPRRFHRSIGGAPNGVAR